MEPNERIIRNREKFSDKEPDLKPKIESFDPSIKIREQIQTNTKVISSEINKVASKLSPKNRNYQEFLFGYQKNNSGIIDKETENISIDSKDQLKLDIKKSRKEPYFRVKRYFKRIENIIEIMPFWKNLLTVFTIVFSFFVPTIMTLITLRNYDFIKDKMLLFYNHSTGQWDNNTDKIIFVSLPFVVLGFNIVLVRYSMMIYNFDKKLVYAISIATIIVNILVLISFTQIIYLVY